MDEKYPKVRTVTVRLITDKPVKKTPYQVKGVFMKQFPDEEIIPMLDGRYREHFLYPRVQVKILNEQIYIVGMNEGVGSVLSLAKQFDFLDFGNITFHVLDVDKNESDDHFQPSPRLIRYRFITPWVALNQMTGSRYRFLNNQEKLTFLNRLLGQNIVFLAREMGLDLKEKVFTKVSLTSLFPKPVDENAWGAFSGEFRTNFILPNYIGIGNGITRGYGAIYGLFNPDMFHFDEESLKKESVKGVPESIPEEDETDIEAISVDEVPKPRKREPEQRKSRSTRRVLSEEFDIEDEEQPGANKKIPSPDENSEEFKFNTEEYHKKQHKF